MLFSINTTVLWHRFVLVGAVLQFELLWSLVGYACFFLSWASAFFLSLQVREEGITQQVSSEMAHHCCKGTTTTEFTRGTPTRSEGKRARLLRRSGLAEVSGDFPAGRGDRRLCGDLPRTCCDACGPCTHSHFVKLCITFYKCIL